MRPMRSAGSAWSDRPIVRARFAHELGSGCCGVCQLRMLWRSQEIRRKSGVRSVSAHEGEAEGRVKVIARPRRKARAKAGVKGEEAGESEEKVRDEKKEGEGRVVGWGRWGVKGKESVEGDTLSS